MVSLTYNREHTFAFAKWGDTIGVQKENIYRFQVVEFIPDNGIESSDQPVVLPPLNYKKRNRSPFKHD